MLKLLRGRVVLQSVVANTGLLIADRALRYGIGFLVGVGIARYLGPEQYGLLSFVLAVAAILVPLMGLGLDSIIIRDFVGMPQQRYEILGSALLLKACGGLAMIVLSLLLTTILRPHDVDALVLVLIMEVAAWLLCFDVIELWFQSQLLSRYPIYAKAFAFLSISAVKIYFIITQAPVIAIILAGFAEALLGVIGLVAFFLHRGMSLRLFRFDRVLLLHLLKDGWALTLASVATVVAMRVDQLIIGSIMDDRRLGIYAAAFRFSEFAYSLPALISVSVLPILVESRSRDLTVYRQRTQTFYNLMTLCSLILAGSTAMLSSVIIPTFFGSDYSDASVVLAIHIWSSVFVFLGTASNQYLIAEHQTAYCLYRTLIGAASNIIFNLILIPPYGLPGAAVAGLCSSAVSVFSIALFPSQFGHVLQLLSSFRIDRSLVLLRSSLTQARR